MKIDKDNLVEFLKEMIERERFAIQELKIKLGEHEASLFANEKVLDFIHEEDGAE